MLADLGQLEDSAEEFIHWGELQLSGEDPIWFVVDLSSSWLVFDLSWLVDDFIQFGDSVVLTSPQLPLLMPELNEADCILAQI